MIEPNPLADRACLPNFMPSFTQSDVDAYLARRAATMARRRIERSVLPPTAADHIGAPTVMMLREQAKVAFTLAPSKDEDKLNKTEKRYLARLRSDTDVEWIGIQSVTLKLGDDCRFTPDFCYIKKARMTFVDTKGGFVREDSTIKIKTAARMFPWASFVVAQLIKSQWTEKQIAG